MTDDHDRLEDQFLREAAGGETPPDLTARVVDAVEKQAIDEAVTPISGAHSVPRSARPRRMTAAVPRRNWQGASIVTAFALLFALGMIAFVVWKGPAAGNTTETAEKDNQIEQPEALPGTNREPALPHSNPVTEDSTQPGTNAPATNLPVEDKQPGPEPVRPIEEPKPEPRPEPQPEPEKPDDVVEQPKPAPEVPDDVVEQPEPDKSDSGHNTDSEPEPRPAVVASFPASRKNERGYPYAVRNADGDWDAAPLIALKSEGFSRASLTAGAELRIRNAPIDLVNGATLNGNCVLSIDGTPEDMTINLVEDDFWLDSTGGAARLAVRYEQLTAECTDAAAVFEADGRKLKIMCAVGTVRCGDEIVKAGEQASLSARGLSGLRPWTGQHSLRESAPSHVLLSVGFSEEPANGLIEGKRIRLEDFDKGTDDWVAFQRGSNAKVSLQFDESVALQPGAHVVIRYRQKGAKKLIIQFWNAKAEDNFGTDLAPGAEDEWQVLRLPIEKFMDRETARIVAKDGDSWMSGGIYLTGEDTELYVDYIRLERKP